MLDGPGEAAATRLASHQAGPAAQAKAKLKQEGDKRTGARFTQRGVTPDKAQAAGEQETGDAPPPEDGGVIDGTGAAPPHVDGSLRQGLSVKQMKELALALKAPGRTRACFFFLFFYFALAYHRLTWVVVCS